MDVPPFWFDADTIDIIAINPVRVANWIAEESHRSGEIDDHDPATIDQRRVNWPDWLSGKLDPSELNFLRGAGRVESATIVFTPKKHGSQFR